MNGPKYADIPQLVANALNLSLPDPRIEALVNAFKEAKNIQDIVEKNNHKDAHELKADLTELISSFDKISRKLKRTHISEKHLYDQYCYLANPYSDLNPIQKNRTGGADSGFESVIAELTSGLKYYHDSLNGGKPKDYSHTDAMVILIDKIHSIFPDIKLSPSESSNLTKILAIYYENFHNDHTSLKDRIKKGIEAYKNKRTNA